MKKTLRLKDPFLHREKKKYAHPLPSREYLIELLNSYDDGISIEQLATLLEIRDDEWQHFRQRLNAMKRDGQIYLKKQCVFVIPPTKLLTGKISTRSDGQGLFVPDEGGEQGLLSGSAMRQVWHGDRVRVCEIGRDSRQRPRLKLIEVLERATQTLVGELRRERKDWLVFPEHPRFSQPIIVDAVQKGEAFLTAGTHAKAGDLVRIQITEPPSARAFAHGKILECLGSREDEGIEIEIALSQHALPHQFSSEALNEAAQYPEEVLPEDVHNRKDLRSIPFITIDGEDARDFDDAVFAQKTQTGWTLKVAIADVSHYVLPGTALDESAYLRGTSVYFPRRVIPMLPENLSNGLCSLNPKVARLALVCEMTLGARGALRGFEFYPAVIQSHARLTYSRAWELIETQETDETLPVLNDLYQVFKCLQRARKRRGALELDTVESQLIFDDSGKISKILPKIRNDAHKMIEEAMLLANVCAAKFLKKHKHPQLFRVHEAPKEEKLKQLRGFLALSGLFLSGGDVPEPKDFAYLLQQIQPRDDAQILHTMILRSLKQAHYVIENKGHFGLAYEEYTHFTSPIRRYPDLVTHRAIKACLQMKKYIPKRTWDELGAHCSKTERRAEEASREVENWLKTYFMLQHVGEVFRGKVSSVTSFGLFVLLDEVMTEGLLHVSDLGQEFFQFNAENQTLFSDSGTVFRMGDTIRVRVARVDLARMRVDFVLVAHDSRKKKRKK